MVGLKIEWGKVNVCTKKAVEKTQVGKQKGKCISYIITGQMAVGSVGWKIKSVIKSWIGKNGTCHRIYMSYRPIL